MYSDVIHGNKPGPNILMQENYTWILQFGLAKPSKWKKILIKDVHFEKRGNAKQRHEDVTDKRTNSNNNNNKNVWNLICLVIS